MQYFCERITKYFGLFSISNANFIKLCLGIILLCCVLAARQIVYSAPKLATNAAIGPYLDGAFPELSPGSADGEWVQVNYYPDLNFVEPIRIVEHPTENKVVIVGKDGKGWAVTHEFGATDKTLFFDITSIMHGKSGVGEGGISDLVFHPEFGQGGSSNANYIYLSYRWSPTQSGTFSGSPTFDGYDRVSRFSVVNSQVDLDTELVLMNQYDRQQWHIGHDMFFGDDGFLYISAGDEGNCCDKFYSTQRIDGGLFSGILRIDVDQDSSRSHPIRRQPTHLEEDPATNGNQWPASFTQNYYIPNDNPFVDESGANLEEFYSIGLRHPWTISQDPATGNIWIADVGQGAMEEISIARKGDNHQWGYMEGTTNGVIDRPANIIGNEAPPVWAYSHDVGKAVIGAGVYRGNKYPELVGKYLFSDFISGKLWTATATASGNDYDIEEIGEVSEGFPAGINSYLLDSKGDILMAATAGALDGNGTIDMLARANDVVPAAEPPTTLSETGAFSNLQNLVPHAGCIPYELNVPFWSDGALKSRWMCVPNDGTHNTNAEKIGFSESGDWSFPQGAVLIKHFELLTDTSDPNSNIRLETRFIVHGTEGYYGVTYRWDDAGEEAYLLTSEEFEVYSVDTPQGSIQQTWQFPSRSDCLVCHSGVAGGVLGPNTRQLNKEIFYPATNQTENQIKMLNSLGMLNPSIANGEIDEFLDSVLTSTPTDDMTQSLAARARSYLDANCSYCHLPGGVRANFDARLTTPLESQGLIFGALAESLSINGEAVIVPGDLSKSILYHRANSAGESFSMPPLAKSLVDTEGMAVVAEWIESLESFEIGNDTTTDGGFIDGHHPSLYINEQDVFVQDNDPGILYVQDFRFYARRLGNPITPLVVRVNGDNDFTVLAIGTTRTQADYAVGANAFSFNDSGAIGLTLASGEKIATGFMDSNPDGTGWGAGTVIPAVAGSGAAQDEIWGLLPQPLISQNQNYNATRDTALAVVNQAISNTNAGRALQARSDLRRSYKFAISFNFLGDSNTLPPAGGPQFVNGSFEQPVVTTFQIYSGINAIPGWTITDGSVEIDRTPWPAFEGDQSMDLNGAVGGTLEQTVANFVAGASYELKFEYGLHKSATTNRSAETIINGAVVKTITANTTMLVPNYQSETIQFVAPSNGQVTFGFRGLGDDSKGVVIDNARIVLGERPTNTPPAPTPIPTSAPPTNNPPAVSLCASGEENLLVNGSFELTSNPAYASAAEMIAALGNTSQGVKFLDKHPDSDFPGWFTTGGIALQQGGFSQGGTIEVGLDGFLGFNTPDGSVFAEMDGNNHSQTISVSPGQLLDWEFTHRGREGTDVVSISIGPATNQSLVATVSSPNTEWVTHSGQYQVPPGVSEILLTLTPVEASDGDIDSSHLLDDVKLCLSDSVVTPPNPEPNSSLINGSFEQPVVTTFQIYSGINAIPGWTITDGSVEIDRTPWPAFEGDQSMDLNGNTGGTLEQTVANFVARASYELKFEYALHKSATTNRSAETLINGAVVKTITANTTMLVPNYQSETIQFVAPSNGQVTFGFRGLGDNSLGVVIDNVRVVSANGPTQPPTISPQFAAQYEAEEADFSGPKILTGRSASGDGYVDFQNSSGDFLEWAVNVPASGAYQIAIQYANGSSENRPMALTINGDPYSSAPQFSPTGFWTTWGPETFTTNLNNGNNTIRLTANGNSGPNFDFLIIGTVGSDAAIAVSARSGDVNCDSEVNSVDALYTLQYDVDLRQAGDCTLGERSADMNQASCDVNEDDTCNAVDALFVLQCDIGLENRLCPLE